MYLARPAFVQDKPVIIPFAQRNCRKSSKKKTRADDDVDKKTDAEGEPVTKASLLRQTETYQEVTSTIILRDTTAKKVDSL